MLTQKISVIYIFLYYFLYGFSYNLSKIDITQAFDKMLSYIQRNKYRTFAMITYDFKEDTDMSEIKQPASALSSPRFCNMGTFMRMQKVDTAEGLDFAIAGAPFDTGSSFRSGSRFGPNAIRNISAMMKPNNVIMQVNIMESLKGGDIGDFNITPGYIHPSYDAIEKGVAGILEKNACPIVLGGDHAITLAELRAVAKKYGPVALVHFDSHSDLCDEVFGQKYNHGTPFRRAIEEGLIDPSHSIQIGMRGSLFVNMFGNFAYWILTLIVAGNFVCHIYFKYVKKGTLESPFAKIYDNDTIIHTFLYALGFIYVVLYACHINITGFQGPEIIIGDSTGGSVIPPIVLGVFGIIIVGAIFMPFLLNYGILEIIGAILEPLMRPLFKVPGKAALDAVSSFVSSSSLGVLITNRLWKRNVYTEKEMVAIMTGFSAVSIGFAYMVINTAKLGDHFVKVYAISFVLVFIIEMITVRIPPISKKKEVYYSGHVQTEAERKNDTKFSFSLLPLGINRAVKRAYIAKNVSVEVKNSLKDSLLVLPQVLTMLSAIGVSGLILAEYTPVFKWLGYIFQPLLVLFRIPDVSAIAPSIPVGIAEMFLPVLVMMGSGVTVCVKARAFVVLVSMVQIIFFSETATVMLATKSPIKFWEIVVCFLERTLIAIPLASLVVHILF